MNKIKNIIFDFDGVIIDSNEIKEMAFIKSLNTFEKKYIDEFIQYHKNNLGIDRYTKLKYFSKNILKSNEKFNLNLISNKFSKLVKENISKKIIIKEVYNFIYEYNIKYNFFIISSADENEIKWISKKLNINSYFDEILGSPEIKKNQIQNLILNNRLVKKSTIYIGDTYSDYIAAKSNKIKFYGYNNLNLKKKGLSYLDKIKHLII